VTHDDTTRRRLGLAVRTVVIAAVAIGLWFFVRTIDWHQLGLVLARAEVWPIAIAVVLNFTCLFGKALSWRVMLAPRYHVSTARLMRYTIAAFAGSVIAPARAGEVLRLWALKRRDGVPVADAAAVAVAEKLLDGVTILMMVAPIPWLLPGLPAWVGTALLACAGVAIVAFVAVFVAVGRIKDSHRSWLARFVAGMHVVRSPGRLVAAMASLFLVWFADLGAVLLVSHAVGITMSLPAGLLVLFALNLTIAIPSTPAQVGALEVGILAAMRLLHVPDEPALAFALLYHALQVIPVIIAGLILELPLVLGRERAPGRELAAAPAIDGSSAPPFGGAARSGEAGPFEQRP
jgi:glycosyltransferase 2 family protein